MRTNSRKPQTRRRVTRGAKVGLNYIALVAGAIFLLFPLIWLFSTALKPDGQEFSIPPRLIPDPAMWENFLRAFRERPLLLYARNSAIIAVTVSFGSVVSASLVGFGFGRLRFAGRDFWFSVLIATLILPQIVTLIPTFLIFRAIGWYNTFLPLIVPAFFGGSAFYVFLMRQFFMTLPKELEDAARVDGCSTLRIWLEIMAPLALPAESAVAIFSFMAAWNDFMGPLIYLARQDLWTFAVGLRFFIAEFYANWNLIMAASLVMLLPVVVLFLFTQRYFVRGIAVTGLAGR
jgi:ABC-type glycerol-3-phosphate transport system permease component